MSEERDIKYKVEAIPEKVKAMVQIVSELENDFPGRHFTLDGNVVGSIGEVTAAFYYGIDLYPPSAKAHDGEVNGKKVQIKTTQRKSISIKHKPDFLIALFLSSDGELYEIYNGPGDLVWENSNKPDKSGNKSLNVKALLDLDRCVSDEDRIQPLHDIKKYQLPDGGNYSGRVNAMPGTFYDQVYVAVKSIPKGYVATYGQIAAMAGSPKASQSVGNALHENLDPDVIPCYRVVNSKGELAKGYAFGGVEGQAKRLREEGIEVVGEKVDLMKYQYHHK